MSENPSSLRILHGPVHVQFIKYLVTHRFSICWEIVKVDFVV